MPELLLCCLLRCSHCRLFCALRCGLLLLQLCLLFNHLGSSAFSPFSTGFFRFWIFHTSLSPNFHTSLSAFFSISFSAFWYYLSFLLPEEASGRNVVNTPACCYSDCLLLFNIRQYFSSYMNARTSSHLRNSVQRFSSFLRASVLPSASTLHSVQTPRFVRSLTFLDWV